MPEMGWWEDEAVVEKNTYSVFRETQLVERLREMGVEEVIVTGVMANLCCETTTREAFVRGFRVFFSTDGDGDGVGGFASSDVEEYGLWICLSS